VPGAERDVARSINLGVVLAKLGRTEEAERRFQRVIVQDDVELVLADGQTIGSQDAARRALGALRRGEYGR
jgi:NACalpha-BTF3-like transcription factor